MDIDESIKNAARALASHLPEKGQRLAAAESCTGGWIAKVITDLPGSSGWFEGGVVAYSNAAKTALLGVDKDTLESEGAVSEATVMQMAEGICNRFAVPLGVAVSGVAGPDGGSEDKPVGTVWIAWAGPDGARAKRFLFPGDREAVRKQTVAAALEGVLGP